MRWRPPLSASSLPSEGDAAAAPGLGVERAAIAIILLCAAIMAGGGGVQVMAGLSQGRRSYGIETRI